MTALRSYLEGEGADFSASMSGKLKMVLQCMAAGLSLFVLAYTESASGWGSALSITLWSAIALTVYSGMEYILKAVSLLRR